MFNRGNRLNLFFCVLALIYVLSDIFTAHTGGWTTDITSSLILLAYVVYITVDRWNEEE